VGSYGQGNIQTGYGQTGYESSSLYAQNFYTGNDQYGITPVLGKNLYG